MPGQRHSVHTLAGLSAQWEKVADFVLAVVGGYRHCYFAFLVGGAIVPGDRFVRRSQQERIRAKSTVRSSANGNWAQFVIGGRGMRMCPLTALALVQRRADWIALVLPCLKLGGLP